MHYIMKDKKVYPATIMEWAQWVETAERTVAKTHLDDCSVSTVFLGLDHQYGDGPPLLFETMIFDGPHDQEQWRYTTREEALVGHEEAVLIARGATGCPYCGVKSVPVEGKCVHCSGKK